MLKLFEPTTTLVIAGSWNPDILSPPWVAVQAMGLQVKPDFAVTARLALGNPQQRPTFGFEGIEYVPGRNTLTFNFDPNSVDSVCKAVSTATKILKLLSHTPVSGFGFNFKFRIENPVAGLLETFSFAVTPPSFLDDDDAVAVARKWVAGVTAHGSLITTTVSLEGGNVVINTNSHFEVGSATVAADRLAIDGLFDQVKKDALAIVNGLHNLGEPQ